MKHVSGVGDRLFLAPMSWVSSVGHNGDDHLFYGGRGFFEILIDSTKSSLEVMPVGGDVLRSYKTVLKCWVCGIDDVLLSSLKRMEGLPLLVLVGGCDGYYQLGCASLGAFLQKEFVVDDVGKGFSIEVHWAGGTLEWYDGNVDRLTLKRSGAVVWVEGGLSMTDYLPSMQKLLSKMDVPIVSARYIGDDVVVEGVLDMRHGLVAGADIFFAEHGIEDLLYEEHGYAYLLMEGKMELGVLAYILCDNTGFFEDDFGILLE